MVRRNADQFLAGAYVNDRPYAPRLRMSVAIAQVFGSALQGRYWDPDLVGGDAIPLAARIDVLPVRRRAVSSGQYLSRRLRGRDHSIPLDGGFSSGAIVRISP
jgi:hypothetical protein